MDPTATEPSEWADETFRDLDRPGAVVRCSTFEDCRFEGCTLRETRFVECRFLDCTFEAGDLSLVKFTDTRLAGVTFRGTKLVGVDWTLAASLARLCFDGCALDYGTFVGLDLTEATLARSMAREAQFDDANLTRADCRESDFEGARFANTRLVGADLRGARNYAIDPRSCPVRGARFTLPEAVALLRGLEIRLED